MKWAILKREGKSNAWLASYLKNLRRNKKDFNVEESIRFVSKNILVFTN